MVLAYGLVLDNHRWSQKKRAWFAFLMWVIPQIAGFAWIAYNDAQSRKNGHKALDFQL